MGRRNNSIIISVVIVAFLVGTIFSSPNYANALPPWVNDILVSIGLLEDTVLDLQTQVDDIEERLTALENNIPPPPPQPQLLFLMDGQVVDSFGGSQVVELVIVDLDIADIDESKGEPDIAVNGNTLRMVQGVDGNWHAFFADRTNALIADSTVIVPGTGFDFGIFCSQTSGFVLGPTIDVTETQGFAIQDPNLVTNGVNGNPTGTPLTNLCANPNPTLTPNDIMVVLNGVTDINTNFPNQELDGQIGISKGFWPFIQLFSFNSGEQVKIIYFKGGMEIEFSIPFTG